MRIRLFLLLLQLTVLLLPSVEPEPRELPCHFIKGGVTLDGRLNETFYTTLPASGGFIQYHPQNGEKSSLRTEVYSYYDKKNIYFAFRCFDSEPGGITADITPFGEYRDNDEVTVYLDAYYDKRTYKSFSVNARGVKSGEVTVWDADARITKDGWEAEFKIPFKSLRFPRGEVQRWGVNFKRRIFRLNEESYWSRVERDRVGVLADTFGTLVGLEKIKRGENIEIFPYLGYRDSVGGETKDSKLAYGVDLKYSVTSNLTLDITTSPDYSEVESDPFFYQYSPYEVNLAENRPFYEEGNEYFDTEFRLFYSRRITDPSLAVKFTGKEKGFSIGALMAGNNTETGDTYHGAIRLKQDIFKLSSIGFIYSSVEEKGDWNRNLGVDFSLSFKDIYTIYGMAAFSRNNDVSHSQTGMYSITALRDVDEGLSLGAKYQRLEPNVYVPAGFVTRVDFQQIWVNARYGFRWEGRPLESINLIFYKTLENSISTGLETANINEFSLNMTTSDRFGLIVAHHWGHSRGQHVTPSGDIGWAPPRFPLRIWLLNMSYQGNSTAKLNLDAFTMNTYVLNDDFTELRPGRFSEITLGAELRISPRLQANFDIKNLQYHSHDRVIDFKGNLFSTTVNYQVLKHLSSFFKFQYDSNMKRFQYDFIVGFEPNNTSKVYFTLKNYSVDRFRLFKSDARSIGFKISYHFRI